MKTKHTGPSKANGTPARPAKATPDMAKSPSQPHELSDKDRAKLKEFLNKSDKPFSVTTVPLNRKRKRTSANLQTQTDLFDDRLSVRYEIKPANNWESLRRYKKFTGMLRQKRGIWGLHTDAIQLARRALRSENASLSSMTRSKIPRLTSLLNGRAKCSKCARSTANTSTCA